ncbi:MAG: hypothetical protein U0165_19795 [Polyangiaceae bacterium]
MSRREYWIRKALCLGLSLSIGFVTPTMVCHRDASRWVADDADTQVSLANGVTAWVQSSELNTRSFSTSAQLFDDEWVFGTYFMAGMGLSQLVLAHPSEREARLPVIDHCIEQLLTERVRAFDTRLWRQDAFQALEHGGSGHVAYAGYLNLLLSLRRSIAPNPKLDLLNDKLSASFEKAILASPTRLIETYPGQVFPVDNMSAVGSIGLRAIALGQPAPSWLGSWAQTMRERFVDPSTGLLYQRVDVATGAPLDAPRGSGTAFGAYMLSFGESALSHELDVAVKRELDAQWLGFGGVREYPRSMSGFGDIDSGPVVFGVGVSATGFSIPSARRLRDGDWQARLLRTSMLFGAPHHRDHETRFVSGGPLGDALMFAMLTAPASPIVPLRRSYPEGG